MTSNARSSRQTGKVVQLRKGATLEMVRHTCPDSAQASLISESFGLPVIDSDGVRGLNHQMIIDTAASLNEGLGNRAMQIHLQRIVGSFVGSAHGVGQFYSEAVTEARDATAKGANDTRDEDLDGAAQCKRMFAADMGLQAHALRCAAEGVVAAHEKVVGEAWNPFQRQVKNPRQTADRKAAELQMAAFG